jgi:hypothetical protein
MYAITATVTREQSNGYVSNRQVPTFYLAENVQGITSEEHARRIALAIIDPFHFLDGYKGSVSVTAVKL